MHCGLVRLYSDNPAYRSKGNGRLQSSSITINRIDGELIFFLIVFESNRTLTAHFLTDRNGNAGFIISDAVDRFSPAVLAVACFT